MSAEKASVVVNVASCGGEQHARVQAEVKTRRARQGQEDNDREKGTGLQREMVVRKAALESKRRESTLPIERNRKVVEGAEIPQGEELKAEEWRGFEQDTSDPEAAAVAEGMSVDYVRDERGLGGGDAAGVEPSVMPLDTSSSGAVENPMKDSEAPVSENENEYVEVPPEAFAATSAAPVAPPQPAPGEGVPSNRSDLARKRSDLARERDAKESCLAADVGLPASAGAAATTGTPDTPGTASTSNEGDLRELGALRYPVERLEPSWRALYSPNITASLDKHHCAHNWFECFLGLRC